MAVCCIVGCSSRSDHGVSEVSFHRFPKDPNLRRAWLIATRRKDFTPGRYSVVCGKHFEKKHITRKRKSNLDPKAIPTLFPTHRAVYEIIEKTVRQVKVKESDNAENSANASRNAVEYIYESEDSEDENGNTDDSMDDIRNTVEFMDESQNIAEVDENVNTAALMTEKENSEEISTGTRDTLEFTQGAPTVIYRVIDASTESKEYLENQLKSITEENKEYRKLIKNLSQKYRRLNSRIAKMEDVINVYKLQHVFGDASLKILNSLPALDNELLTLQLSDQSLQFPEKVSSSVAHLTDAEMNCLLENSSI